MASAGGHNFLVQIEFVIAAQIAHRTDQCGHHMEGFLCGWGTHPRVSPADRTNSLRSGRSSVWCGHYLMLLEFDHLKLNREGVPVGHGPERIHLQAFHGNGCPSRIRPIHDDQ